MNKQNKTYKMKKLVVLTGAGMSAESGIATFRDSGGLWDKYPVEQVATPEAFDADPDLVQEFYNVRRRELLAAKPNPGHFALAELEKHFDVEIVTQNIDNLHEQAGSTNVLHLHGELMKSRSVLDDTIIYDIDPADSDLSTGMMCERGYQLRPHIVWFGEPVPLIEDAAIISEQADVYVIIGTQMSVYPAAGLLQYVPSGVPVYLIDPKEVAISRRGVIHIMKGASEGMKELTEILLKDK